jgi:arylformamidase
MNTTALPRFVDLSHPIEEGMITYPGLPGPHVETLLSREDAEAVYGPGVTFHIGMVHICTNTGTYLDVPFHRFDDGHDLADLVLERVAQVPAVCLDRRGIRAIDLDRAEVAGLAGHAVLIRTDHSERFGTEDYGVDHPHLVAHAAEVLVDAGVACVGIDSLNIDSTDDPQRPVHTALLGAGIPIVEHLAGLGGLPRDGFTFTAVPPKLRGAGTFTVRAFATV